MHSFSSPNILHFQDAAVKDASAAVEKEERLVAELEAARSTAQAQAERFQSELDSLRGVLARTSTEERRQAREHSTLEEAVAAKRVQLAAANADVDRLATELATLGRSALTAEEQAAALEQQLREEEAYTQEVQRQIDAISVRLATVQQINHDLKSQSTATVAEVDGIEQSERNVGSRMGQIRRELVQQGQIMCVACTQNTCLALAPSVNAALCDASLTTCCDFCARFAPLCA